MIYILFWTTKKHKKKTSRPLHSKLRKIQGLQFKKVHQLFVRARLSSLLNQRVQERAIIMFKVKYNLCPKLYVRYFNLSNRSYNLRNSGNFMIPRINTATYGKHIDTLVLQITKILLAIISQAASRA